MEPTPATDRSPGTDGVGGDLTNLLLAVWRNRVLIALVTVATGLVFWGYSFTLTPVYSARVTILPQANNASASMLGPLASMLETPLGLGESYEQLYGQILVSDRILDQAIARSWRHTRFAGPVSLFDIFGVKRSGAEATALEDHELKRVLRSRVISFSRQKTGFMVLTVDGPQDGEFAADLANFLVDQLDAFNVQVKAGKATERYTFLAARLAETEKDLRLAEGALTDFKVNNRAYAAAPELMQEFGVLSREIQAQTTIWVELRKQLELAEIEMNKGDTSVDILDRASEPVVRSKPQRSLYAVVGLLSGLLLAMLLLILKRQLVDVRRVLGASPAE